MIDPPDIDYLTAEELIEVAKRAVNADVIVLDVGLLASAAARPQSIAFGEDAYPTMHQKVAALLCSLVGNHALGDGNKRLGWAAAVVFCRINDIDLRPEQDHAFDLVMRITSGQERDIVKIGAILRTWMRPIVPR